MWLRLAPYFIYLASMVILLVGVNNRAYDRGAKDAEQVCAETTVPAAEEKIKKTYAILTATLKEENDAVLRDAKRLRATYDRLRQTKPIANGVPLAAPSYGDIGPNAANIPSGKLGVSTEWLDATFYEAANDIARGESCQRQLKNIYVLNGVTP